MTKQDFKITVHKGPLFEKVVQQSQMHLLTIAKRKVEQGKCPNKISSKNYFAK